MAMVRRLHKSGASFALANDTFFSLVFSHICFAWPAQTELNMKYLKKYEVMYKQLHYLYNRTQVDNLSDRLNKICEKLCQNISKSNAAHPLIECFQPNHSSCDRYGLRNIHKYLPLRAKTNLLKLSFTQYAYKIKWYSFLLSSLLNRNLIPSFYLFKLIQRNFYLIWFYLFILLILFI